MKKRSSRKDRGPAPPRVRLPLPRQTEKAHGDAGKFRREKEKERLRREIDRESEPPT